MSKACGVNPPAAACCSKVSTTAPSRASGRPSKPPTGLAALLQAEPGIRGVFSSNVQAAIGAAQALREAGLSDQVHHIGFDFDEGTLDLIDNGQLGATLAQGTWQMGFWGLMFVYMVRNGLIESVSDWQAAGISPLPPNVDTGVVVINRDNSRFWRAS